MGCVVGGRTDAVHRYSGVPLPRCLWMLIVGVAFLQGAEAADTVRVATYNLLNYPGTDAAVRNPYFRAVLRTMDPDVLVVQEMTSSSGVSGFLNNVLNLGQAGMYSAAPFNNGPDTDNAFFYKPTKVSFVGATYIGTALRNIAEYRFIPSGQTDTVRVYSVHLKANEADSLLRFGEATILRDRLNVLPQGARFIVGGDFNIYRSSEPAFQKLIGSEANNNGRCKDPLNAIGNWHANFSFRAIHTQSTRTRSFGDGATGGLDDRFDMLLISYSMDSLVIPSSYTAYGNDGNHFNDSINRLPNAAVPDSVANGLHYATDHLPVFADFVFGGSAGGTGFTTVASGNWSNPSIWSGGAVPAISNDAVVAPGTVVTIDGDALCNSLFVSGTLQFDATTGRSLSVHGTLTISGGGEVRASAPFSSGSATQALFLGGSLINDGMFSARVAGSSSGTRVVNVVLNGGGAATIAGATNPVTFNVLSLNKASTSTTVLPIIDVTFAGNTAGALTLTRGTWVQEIGHTITPNVNITVDTNAVLIVDGDGAFSTGAASLLVHGTLHVAGGTLNVGMGNNRLEVLGTGAAEFLGGQVFIKGRMTLSGGVTSIAGSDIAIDPRGTTSLSANSNVFEAAGAASVAMTGGSLTIVNPKTATANGREVRIVAGTGGKTFAGGQLMFGDGISTVAGSDTGFTIDTAVPLPEVVLRSANVAGREVTSVSSLTMRSLLLESGRLRQSGPFGSGFDVTVAGSIRRTGGSLVSANRTILLVTPTTAEETSVAGGFTGPNALFHLQINNSGGVVLDGDIEVQGTLTVNTVLRTDTSAVVLLAGATLVEPPGNTVLGLVTATRNVFQNVTESFGSIGWELTAAGAAPGMTTVLRETGVASVYGGGQSILRRLTVTPTNNSNLDATVVMRYDTGELNTNVPHLLRLWRSSDAGTSWQLAGGIVDTAARTVSVSGLQAMSLWTAADTVQFDPGLVTRQYAMSAGWNVISLPLAVPNPATTSVFPTASSSAFGFAPSTGYQQQDSLLTGSGYWLKFAAGEDVAITGRELLADTIPVTTGWNMIGALSEPVPVDSVGQIPPGIVVSGYYAYQAGYVETDTLHPSKGYWVKVNQPGVLVVSTGSGSQLRIRRTGDTPARGREQW